jgi:uncharacterized cupredoxin-like copper-binding protein
VRPVILAAALGICTGVFAHGDRPHGAPAFDYAKAEPTRFGIAVDPGKATRTIRVDMSDSMRFLPAEIELRRGEAVRFVAANKGKVLHEMVLGTMSDLQRHAEVMRKHPGMQHGEPNMAHVAPGKTGEIGWRFTQAGTFYFACLIPGHFEAGMVGRITVR